MYCLMYVLGFKEAIHVQQGCIYLIKKYSENKNIEKCYY